VLAGPGFRPTRGVRRVNAVLAAVRGMVTHAVAAPTCYPDRLIPAGAGAACIFSASFATDTLGVQRTEAGIASAVVNTAQQIGGSIGTALLSTIFAGALSGYLASHSGMPNLFGDAAVHAYTVGFTAGQ
jgi:hypothetical protein